MASLIAVLLTRSFTRPIHRIEHAVKCMADGELNAAPNVARAVELGRLSRSVERKVFYATRLRADRMR